VAINHSSETPIFDPSASDMKSSAPTYPALVIASSPAQQLRGARFPVHKALIAGREAGDDINLVIDDGSMSRRHARFRRQGNAIEVEDLGSTNGTFLNGARLPPNTAAPLDAASVVRLGQTLVCFEAMQVRGEEGATVPPPFVGSSAIMQQVYAALRKIAPAKTTVLVLGATGTGKELTAQALHALSGRSGACVAVNCSAITETVAESLFFGHKKGAFSGAATNVSGYFEQAAGGTLFLDEVSELEQSLQAKLLRALESGEIQPVGGSPEKVDVRVVCAANVELEARVKAGDFRPDLYARIAATTLRLPTLDQRKSDIPELLQRFVGPGRSADAILLEALMLRAWPYNVRELKNVVKQVLTEAGDDPSLRLAHLPAELRAPGLPAADRAEAAVTREQLEQLLQKTQGNVALVARSLGKDRRQVYRWLEEHGIDPAAFR
jgi:DNA-binding NtrC family response regulator